MPGKIIWECQPKQAAFLSRPEYEALYGGAAGGGKSDALLVEGLRQVEIPHYRGIIFRKTIPQLSDLIDRSGEIYKSAFPKAKYNDNKHVWTFPSGAKIYFGNMQHLKDRTNYQGKRYDYIGFDELTHFLFDEYSYMMSRNRPGGPGTRCYMRSSANPGNIGHAWVKARFITPVKPMTPIVEQVKIRFPDGHEEIRRRDRIFVPSSVFDNAKLLENDPDYISRLAMLPESERNALLYGDWDSFSGQVFSEWRNNPDRYADRISTHVVEPFTIPSGWGIWRSFDFGYSKPFSVGWYAVDHDRRIYRIRELYGCTGTPNTGVRWEPARIAREIKRMEAEDKNLKGRKIRGVADPSIFDESRGESIAVMMAREGIYFDKGDNARLPGKMQVHNRLAFDEAGIPMLYIFHTCTHCIRTLPALVYSQTDPEDIDTDTEDHIYDELRYMLMEYPVAPPEKKAMPVEVYDPLSTDNDVSYDKYEFFRRY